MARVTGGDVIVRLMEEVAELREAVRTIAATTKRMEGNLIRMGRLLGTMADETRKRFETVESRLDALESRR